MVLNFAYTFVWALNIDSLQIEDKIIVVTLQFDLLRVAQPLFIWHRKVFVVLQGFVLEVK